MASQGIPARARRVRVLAGCGRGQAGGTIPRTGQGVCMENRTKQDARSPGLMDVLKSVIASMFGVQSNRNREKDFTHGKPWQYIIIGLLMTVVFMLTVWGVVKLVMWLAGV